MLKADIKKCPFCDSEAELNITETSKEVYVQCSNPACHAIIKQAVRYSSNLNKLESIEKALHEIADVWDRRGGVWRQEVNNG